MRYEKKKFHNVYTKNKLQKDGKPKNNQKCQPSCSNAWYKQLFYFAFLEHWKLELLFTDYSNCFNYYAGIHYYHDSNICSCYFKSPGIGNHYKISSLSFGVAFTYKSP